MRGILLCLAFVSIACFLFSQGPFIPLGTNTYPYMDRLDVKYSRILPPVHTSDKPYRRKVVANVSETLQLSNLRFDDIEKYQLKYLMDENAEWLDTLKSFTYHPWWKFYREPATFLHYDSKNKDLFSIRVNPMFEFHTGIESQNNRFLFSRAVGVEVRGSLKKVFNFYFNATGNSARLPEYVTDKTEIFSQQPNTGLNSAYMPGEGYYKIYASGIFGYKDAVDYFDARGYVNANILKYIDLSFGRDKFFIGDGERSLVLSDYSAPFLFLKFDVHFWRFEYENIFGQLTSEYYRGADELLPTKYMALHHLTMQANHWLHLGIFESVIFARSTFDASYLNPLIFYKAVEASLGNPDKVFIGGDFRMNFVGHLSFYGQALLDEFSAENFFKRNGWWGNKWAFQLGTKYIDIFPHLDGQIEFNLVRPFTYTADGTDNYTNYNQPMADPLGANFYEFIFSLRYQPIDKWTISIKYMAARVGDDTINPVTQQLTNYGGDILQYNGAGTLVTNQYGNHLGQGAKGTISYFQFLTSYEIWHNINFDLEMTYRGKNSIVSVNNPNPSGDTFIFQVGVRVNMAYKSYMF